MLTQWNHVALNGLRQEMDRLFQRFEYDWPADAPVWNRAELDGPQFMLRDAGESLEITADVPGFQNEDLHVSFEQGSLIVRGERSESVPEGYSVHRKERGGLRFARAFTLPARIDPDKIEASLRNGVLELHLPKAAEERPRMISVKAA
jgi:HSP20 family protein